MIKNFFLLNFNKNNHYSNYEIQKGENSSVNVFSDNLFTTIIFGNPSYTKNLNIENFYKDWKNKYDRKNFKEIDGEFIIIEISKREDSIKVINSRFASPTLYYYIDNETVYLSNNFFCIAKKLYKVGKFKINQNAVYEFFKFRRIFGNKTLDINSRFLMPFSVLDIQKSKFNIYRYWKPNYKKNNRSLEDNAYSLKEELVKSWNFLLSDIKKPILMLSGGLDTRFALATCPVELDCLNFSYSENRESEAAKKSCEVVNQKYIWSKLNIGKYQTYHDYSSRVNSSMYVVDAVHYGHEEIIKNYDAVFSGYAIDWFFQGWYCAYSSIKFFGNQLYLKIPREVDDDFINFFLTNCLFIAKGHSIDFFIKSKDQKDLFQSLLKDLNEILNEAKEYSDNKNDWYDFINIGNPSRKYSYGAQLCLKEYGKHRILPFTNNLYNLYLQLPHKHKFDARVERKALEITNKKLANIPSGNTGFKVKYGSLMQTACSGAKFLKRISTFKKRDKSLQRTWLEFGDIMRKEYKKDIINLKNDNEINDLKFIDHDKLSNYINNWEEGSDKVSSHFLHLMLTYRSFINQLRN